MPSTKTIFLIVLAVALLLTGTRGYSEETDRAKRNQRLKRQASTILLEQDRGPRDAADEELLRRRTANRIVSLTMENVLSDSIENETVKERIKSVRETLSDFGRAFRDEDETQTADKKKDRISVGLDMNKRAAPAVKFGENIDATYDWRRERVMVAYTVNF